VALWPGSGECTLYPLPGQSATLLGVGSTEGLGFRDPQCVLACVPELSRVHRMRTNIEIDDKLMKDALRATGAKTKREAVELGLKTLVQLRAQEKARDLRGKITWEGDLNAMRTDR
jgi:Arc/MetJ family transcription regulator